MISLDEQIKKDKDNNHKRNNYGRDNRERSRDRYRSRQGRRHYNRDEEKRTDHSRKHHHYQPKPQKTIVKFSQLHYSVTKQQLKALCEKYGSLKFCRIHWDKMGRSNETAIVGFFNGADAQKAANQMNHTKFEDMEVITQLCFCERKDHKNNQEQNNWVTRNRNNRRFDYND